MKKEETLSESRLIELNKLLEEKVSGLMSEVDLILKKQMHVMHMPARHESKVEPSEERARAAVKALDRPDLSNDAAPWMAGQGKQSISDALVSFFKGQITKLQSDLQSMQHEKNKMQDQCKDLQAQLCKQQQAKDKLLNQQHYYKDHILQMESANSHMSLKIQTQNAQMSSLQKDIETLKKKLASLSQLSAYNELRINRSLDENAKLRSTLKISQSEEKDSREHIRKIQEDKRLALKFSEKQRTDIYQAFKKQMQLVNNLNKQKLYLESNKQVQFIEREFTKILDANNR